MNALVKKEIRLLLPNWAVTLLLALSASLVADHNSSTSFFRVYILFFLPFMLAPAMLVMLALDSFGREFGTGTISNLLAQPLARSRIWWTKTLLLAAALFSAWGIWWLCVITNKELVMNAEQRHDVFRMTLVMVTLAYSGGLWTVLLLRQAAAAFWFTLLIPGALSMLTLYFTKEFGGHDFFEAQFTNIVICVLLAYSVAGFFWARWMFLRAQDVQWTGGEIALPGWLKLPRLSLHAFKLQGRRPRLALLAKEFHLHQSQFVIAGVLALVHLGLIVARNASGGFKESPGLEFVSYQIWGLWPVMALLIGCAAVAEERKLGTLEAQLCLPARRRTQFLIKTGIALVLALVFGVVAPVLLEGGRILPNINVSPENTGLLGSGLAGVLILKCLLAFQFLMPFLPLLLVAGVTLGIGFYASTLARNTLQAIAPAILGICAFGFYLGGASQIENLVRYPLWRGSLIYFIGVPVLMVAVAVLAYWNFKRVLVGWPVWRRNAWVWLAALLFIATATTGIYQRSWELLFSAEVRHGPALLSPTSAPALSTEAFNSVVARFPDGRLWRNVMIPSVSLTGGITSQEADARYLDGTNWIAAAPLEAFQTAAIKSDGSLWLVNSGKFQKGLHGDEPVLVEDTQITMTQIGHSNGWRSVARLQWLPAVLLLKSDGSLWRWGKSGRTTNSTQSISLPEPERLGVESDWADMLRVGGSAYLWKQNGRAWAINPVIQGPKQNRIELVAGLLIEPIPMFDHVRFRSMAQGQPYQVGVCVDGSLWGWGLPPWLIGEGNTSTGKIGNDTNWLSVAACEGGFVALKADGSLWAWKLDWRLRRDAQAIEPARLGNQKDWVAVAGTWNGILSLAADGGLWFWQFDWPNQASLLRPSRRPQLVGNILAAAQ